MAFLGQVNVPIRDPDVQAEIERRALTLSGETAGKLTVEYNLKDGVWTLGNVSVLFARHRHLTTRGLEGV